MADGEVRMRLIRADDAPPTNPLDEPFEFGLQDVKQQLLPGKRDSGGRLVFDFSLKVKPGKDPDRLSFGGLFASGPADDRFVYLAWRSIPRGVWINRIKAKTRLDRLGDGARRANLGPPDRRRHDRPPPARLAASCRLAVGWLKRRRSWSASLRPGPLPLGPVVVADCSHAPQRREETDEGRRGDAGGREIEGSAYA